MIYKMNLTLEEILEQRVQKFHESNTQYWTVPKAAYESSKKWILLFSALYHLFFFVQK